MRRYLPIASAIALTACTAGADYTPPPVASPASFAATAADVASLLVASDVDRRWWTSFGDHDLDTLVARLSAQNLDLLQATERIEQVRAERPVVASGGAPQVGATGLYQRQRVSPDGLPSLTQRAPGAPLDYDLFRPSASASWQLDLFGRVRRAVEAGGATIRASVEARSGIQLAAIGELAQAYMQLRVLQAQQQILLRNVALAERRRAIVRRRFADGSASVLEIAQADAQGLVIAQDLPGLRSGQAQLVNAIGLLLAEPPRALQGQLSVVRPLPLVPARVPVGLPADLVRRRPDIREAEARLHAATATTGVAVASFYPSVTLSGNFGFESLSIGSLFDAASRIFAVGPAIDIPLFQGGRLTGMLHLREAQQREAALAFRQTVLRAWHEVDNALVAYAEAQHRLMNVVAAHEAVARQLAVADRQYATGTTSLLDVVVAQEELLRSDAAQLQARADVNRRLIDLYQALGGGWE